jgi:hypothetical protein
VFDNDFVNFIIIPNIPVTETTIHPSNLFTVQQAKILFYDEPTHRVHNTLSGSQHIEKHISECTRYDHVHECETIVL